jgi:hypothetical protein
MLKHLQASRFVPESCVALVNQTRTVLFFGMPNPPEKVPPEFVAAARNLEERSWAPVFIGDWPSRPAMQLVQRETLDEFFGKKARECRTTIRFSLAGYGASGTAAIAYTMHRSMTDGEELGEGVGLLRHSAEGWTVEREDYHLLMRSSAAAAKH